MLCRLDKVQDEFSSPVLLHIGLCFHAYFVEIEKVPQHHKVHPYCTFRWHYAFHTFTHCSITVAVLDQIRIDHTTQWAMRWGESSAQISDLMFFSRCIIFNVWRLYEYRAKIFRLTDSNHTFVCKAVSSIQIVYNICKIQIKMQYFNCIPVYY